MFVLATVATSAALPATQCGHQASKLACVKLCRAHCLSDGSVGMGSSTGRQEAFTVLFDVGIRQFIKFHLRPGLTSRINGEIVYLMFDGHEFRMVVMAGSVVVWYVKPSAESWRPVEMKVPICIV